jgi:hypothetical protein
MEQNFTPGLVNTTVDQIAELLGQKDKAYAERNLCVALVACIARWHGYTVGIKTHPQDDPEWDPEWMHILFIDLPTGQVSWHLHISEVENFPDIPVYQGTWDGHTTEEKYDRVKKLVRLAEGKVSAKSAKSD